MKKKGLRVLSTAVLLGVGIASTMSLTGCKKDPVESQAPASSLPGTTTAPQPSSSSSSSSSSSTTAPQTSSSSSSSTTAPQPSSSSSSTSSEEEKEFNLSFVSKYGEAPAAYKSKTIELPQMSDVTYPYGGKYVFGGWYLDDSFENEAVAGTKLSADAILYAKWTKEALAAPTTAPSGYEVVTKNLSVDSLEAKTYADGYSDGTFIISKGTAVRNRTKTWTNPDDAADQIVFNKSIKVGSASNLLSVESQGEGVLEFYVQNGSSGVQTRTIKITNPDGSVTDIVIPAGDAQWDYPAGSPIVKISYAVGKGTYSINRDTGTVDIYAAKLTTICEVASETGFKITDAGTTEFIEGQQLDLSKMRVDAVFGNGRTESIALDSSDLVIDSSAVLMNTPGKYQISVKYKDYEAQTIDVIVYEIVEIKTLGFNATEKLAQNSAAGNGVYYNQTVQRVFDLNEAFNSNYLNVIVKCSDGTKTKEFRLTSTDYEINSTEFDNTVVGEYQIHVTVTLNGTNKVANYKVYVVDATPSVVNEVVQVKVNPNYTGVIGSVDAGYNTFTSIQQALDYLGKLDESYKTKEKLLYIAAGTYNEKVEITVPYLTIVGEDKETTKIEWNSLYGIEDESGFEQVTDSTQTLAVRDSAIGCTIKNLTISNYWNNYHVFDDAFGYNYAEHRALALLVQSDQFKMDNCKLLGYQDTVEFFTGRQYITNTYIEGLTDFIFGTNNTTYFNKCEIHSIDSGKVKTFDADGNPSEYNTDGGYITAFKGCNKGSSDYVKYGAVFDDCDFTADEFTTANHNTAIGRNWGNYAAVMVMNSRIGAHVSTVGNDSGNVKGARYVTMSCSVLEETVKFTEYNNTGAGAITESVAGGTVITDAEIAAKYNDLSVIFGAGYNGAVNYTTSWDPTIGGITLDTNVYYMFDGSESTTGTTYKYTENCNGTTTTLGDLTIDGTAGKVTSRGSDTQINAGGKIIFDVKAGTTVTVKTYPGYHNYSLNGVEPAYDDFAQYYAIDTTVTLEATGTMYLFKIIVSTTQAAPEAATCESITLSGAPTDDLALGTDVDFSKMVVKATYSDGSIRTIASGDYEIDTTNVLKDVEGTYEVVVRFAGKEAKFNVKYVATVSNAISANTTWSFKDDTANASDNYFVFDNTNFTFNKLTVTGSADNGDWIQFNNDATATFEVAGPCTVTVMYYKSNVCADVSVNGGAAISGTASSYEQSFDYVISEAGVVTIKSNVTGNGYIGKIIVTFA